MDLHGKVVLLTGASKGIGHALARTLAEDGCRLVVSARSREPLEALRDDLSAQGTEVVAVVGDVSVDADARKMADAATAAFGHVDVLVNNAAVITEPMPVVKIPVEDWELTLRVNVIGTANMIRHVLPGMEARGAGVIVNMSSGWGRFADADVAPYCASKFGVEALTQAVAKEAQAGVTIFALNPGVIATEMLARAFQTDVSTYTSPEELAPRWRTLFRGVGPSWHGSSRNL